MCVYYLLTFLATTLKERKEEVERDYIEIVGITRDA